MGELRKGCARSLEAGRYSKKLNDGEIGRLLYSEIMETIKKGRVPLSAAKFAIELCEREIEDLEESIENGAKWTLGR